MDRRRSVAKNGAFKSERTLRLAKLNGSKFTQIESCSKP